MVTEKVGQCFDECFISLKGFYHFFTQNTKNVHTVCISITKEFLTIQWVNALSKFRGKKKQAEQNLIHAVTACIYLYTDMYVSNIY